MDMMEYTSALELFLNAMTSEEKNENNSEALQALCQVLHIGRIEANFYENSALEHIGQGTQILYYHSGNICLERLITERNVSNDGSIVLYRLYGKTDAPEWTAQELSKIHLILHLLYAFNARDKLLKIVDKLTFFDQELGIHNLRYYLRCLGVLHEREELAGHTGICFNLKRFSAVNEQLGRSRGTMIMRNFVNAVAEKLQSGEIICRLGGDNFIMLVHTEHTETILNMLTGTEIVYDTRTGDSVLISANVGVYTIDKNSHIEIASDIMDRISAAAHIARESGEHDVIFFDESMMTIKSKNMKIVNLFPKALRNEELLVYYQPKIALDGYTIAGAEALCRWLHDGKVISPGDFIPVLEKGMEICSLDFYILEHVCKDIRRWLDNGKNVVKVSVNLSRRHMTDMDLLEHIISIVDKYQVPHQYIEIELTETTTDVEFKDLKRIVSGLQAAGFSTSVDDFGIGYSSLTLIKDIPWDVLKVDKSFLPGEQDDSEDKQKRIMFKYVLAMAQEMGMECVAEGVETREQLDLLKENCCNLAQGFFFDRPLTVDEFEKRLDDCCYQI